MIKVKNVKEAKTLLRRNGIKTTGSGYTNGNEGWITSDNSEAEWLIKSMGLYKY